MLFSRTGLCPRCSEVRMLDNHRDLKDHRGPFFEHWRRRTLAAFGVFLDEPSGD